MTATDDGTVKDFNEVAFAAVRKLTEDDDESVVTADENEPQDDDSLDPL